MMSGVTAVVHALTDNGFLADTAFGEYGFDGKHVCHSHTMRMEGNHQRGWVRTGGGNTVLALEMAIYYLQEKLTEQKHLFENEDINYETFEENMQFALKSFCTKG